MVLSVVVPVYNKWELTRNCLESLAVTGGEDLEVLLVDNASTDETPQYAPSLGRSLFGERFFWLRQPVNRNFAGACNLGAQAASGEMLFFLNNDTLLTPGWRAPLHQAIQGGALAASPLLVYPDKTVQHIGVTFDPCMRLSHVYEFFPCQHPVVRRKRALQALTAAALYVPKFVFLECGGFDERFRNGFEDVEFCARLSKTSGTTACFASVAESVITHLCSQTPGRHEHMAENARILTESCSGLFQPDRVRFLEEDGYELRLSPWGGFEPALPVRQAYLLAQNTPLTEAALVDALEAEPYWKQGYTLLAELLEHQGRLQDALIWRQRCSRFWRTPETLLPLASLASCMKDTSLEFQLYQELRTFLTPREERVRRMREHRRRFRRDFPLLAHDAEDFLIHEGQFQARYTQIVSAIEALYRPLQHFPM